MATKVSTDADVIRENVNNLTDSITLKQGKATLDEVTNFSVNAKIAAATAKGHQFLKTFTEAAAADIAKYQRLDQSQREGDQQNASRFDPNGTGKPRKGR